jgi:hypothetical protein
MENEESTSTSRESQGPSIAGACGLKPEMRRYAAPLGEYPMLRQFLAFVLVICAGTICHGDDV